MGNLEYRFLTQHIENGVVVLTFTNPTLNADAVTEALTVVNAAENRKIILDCQWVRFLVGGSLCPDQEPFTPLLKLRKQLTDEGGRLILCNVATEISEVFRIIRLGKTLEIQPDVQSALVCMDSDCMSPKIEIIEGDLLDQDVDVIVNEWNRNIIPWWLLLPQGVSGAIKRRGGNAPFKEVGKHGAIRLGGAVMTSAGKLPFKGIIHVAGINMIWRSSERSIRDSVKNAVRVAHDEGFTSIGFPLIGAGSGGFDQEQTKKLMLDELSKLDVPMTVKIVVFKKSVSDDEAPRADHIGDHVIRDVHRSP